MGHIYLQITLKNFSYMTNRLNLPNRITLFRLFLLPLVVVFLISSSNLGSFFAALIFGIASFTDWLDGHIARSTDQITTLGKLLDPIVDKLLIIAAMIPLVEMGRVPSWIAVIILGREFSVSGLRIIASYQHIILSAIKLGKYKMIAEIAGIILLILDYKLFYVNFRQLGLLALVIAVIFGIISAIKYFEEIKAKWHSESFTY